MCAREQWRGEVCQRFKGCFGTSTAQSLSPARQRSRRPCIEFRFVSFLFFAGKQVVYDNNNTHICTRLCVCVLQIESLAVLNVG